MDSLGAKSPSLPLFSSVVGAAFRLSSPPFHLSSRSSVVRPSSFPSLSRPRRQSRCSGERSSRCRLRVVVVCRLLLPSYQARYLFSAFNPQGKARTFDARRTQCMHNSPQCTYAVQSLWAQSWSRSASSAMKMVAVSLPSLSPFLRPCLPSARSLLSYRLFRSLSLSIAAGRDVTWTSS